MIDRPIFRRKKDDAKKDDAEKKWHSYKLTLSRGRVGLIGPERAFPAITPPEALTPENVLKFETLNLALRA